MVGIGRRPVTGVHAATRETAAGETTGPAPTPAVRRPDDLVGLIAALVDDPHRPVLVAYDRDGARTELSASTLANWTAKVAGLLRDELGLGPGDLAAVRCTTGWQLAPVLLGCWWAGVTVTGDDDPSAAAAFVPQGGDAAADEVFVLSGHPLGAPATDVASHQRDFTTAVLPQPDRLGSPAGRGERWPAVGGPGAAVTGAAVTGPDLLAAAMPVAARAVAAAPSGRRPVLVSTLEWTLPDGVARTLLVALAAGGCLVQCPAGYGPDRIAAVAAAERATSTVGADVPGIARLDR